MAKKETIKPPNKRELTQASKLLRSGSSAGARVMADMAVAVKEGVSKKRKKR